MSRTGIAWAALVASLALVALAVLAWRGTGASDVGAIAPAPAAGADAAEAASLRAAAADEREEARARVAEAAGADAPAAEPSADEATLRHVRVVVLDAASRRPIGGAEVLVLDEDTRGQEPYLRAEALGEPETELFARCGAPQRADDDGVALVPRPARFQTTLVAARAGDSFASGQFDHESDGVVLELRPSRRVRVQVVDADGAPVAGAVVALRTRSRDDIGGGDHARATTAEPSGIAELIVPHDLAEWTANDGDDMLVSLAIPLAPPVEAPIDPRELPHDPVRLVLPPTGSVEVLVRTPGGAPVARTVDVRLVSMLDDDWWRFLGRDLASIAVTESGRALFAHVGVGTELRAEATLLGGGEMYSAPTNVAATLAAGPAAKDERVTIEVVLDADAIPCLVGRAVREDGSAVVEAMFGVQISSNGRRLGHQLFTDPDGRFRWELPAGSTYDEITLATDPFLRATIELPGTLPGGDFDLGDVVLRAPPLIAAGVVVDGSGAPFTGASVRAYEGGDANRERWVSAWTDDRGSFELRGDFEAQEGVLELLWTDVRVAEPVSFVRGASDLRIIVVDRSGSVEARVLLDDDLPAWRVDLVLHGEGDRMIGYHSGVARWEHLAPGTYALTVSADTAEPLVRIDDIVVRDRPADDPRLDPIDLRGVLRRVEITVVDERGEPIPDASGRVRGPAEGAWSPWPQGRASFVTGRAPFDLEVGAPGYRWTLAHDVEDGDAIALRRGIPVRLVLEGAPLPQAPWRLDATLSWTGSGFGGRFGPEEPVDARGEALLHVTEPGRHEVAVLLANDLVTDGDHWRSNWPGDYALGYVDVLDVEDEQVFRIAVPQRLIDAGKAHVER